VPGIKPRSTASNLWRNHSCVPYTTSTFFVPLWPWLNYRKKPECRSLFELQIPEWYLNFNSPLKSHTTTSKSACSSIRWNLAAQKKLDRTRGKKKSSPTVCGRWESNPGLLHQLVLDKIMNTSYCITQLWCMKQLISTANVCRDSLRANGSRSG
jgi:hypothetical protein